MNPFLDFKGTIHYQQFFALLRFGNGTKELTLIHFNPMGHYTPQDGAASASYFHNALGKVEGDALEVLAEIQQLNGVDVLLWAKAQ